MVPRLWQKLSVNAAINAATALARCKNGAIGSTPAGRWVCFNLWAYPKHFSNFSVKCSLVLVSFLISTYVYLYLACPRELLEDICNECAPIAVKACDLQDIRNAKISTKNDEKNEPGDSLVLNHPLIGSKELTKQVSQPFGGGGEGVTY